MQGSVAIVNTHEIKSAIAGSRCAATLTTVTRALRANGGRRTASLCAEERVPLCGAYDANMLLKEACSLGRTIRHGGFGEDCLEVEAWLWRSLSFRPRKAAKNAPHMLTAGVSAPYRRERVTK